MASIRRRIVQSRSFLLSAVFLGTLAVVSAEVMFKDQRLRNAPTIQLTPIAIEEELQVHYPKIDAPVRHLLILPGLRHCQRPELLQGGFG